MKSFSELTSASQVNNGDLLAISQTSGNGYASKKTTVKEIADFSNLNLAEEYDSTSTYAVDDYCIYESVLYKCIASTTGTFDSTKWTSVVVTDEMGSGGGGGTGGHTIIDENGNSMTARAGLQFVGGANVSDDSTNNKTIVDVASAGGIDGVFFDTGNVIVQETSISASGLEYTATEDCYVVLFIIGNDTVYINIDGEYVAGNFSLNVNDRQTFQIPLKKGQTLTTTSGSANNTYIVYGIQTGTTHSKFQPVIYSTEEREIGVWTDGKPLYCITFDKHTSPVAVSGNTWTTFDTFSEAIKVIDARGVVVDGNSGIVAGYYPIHGLYQSGNIKILHTRNNVTDAFGYVTIYYTKDSDTAGSGTWTPQGVPAHHYSTDEHIIGTWIDGKTLWEKTYDFSSNYISIPAGTSWRTTDIDSSNIGMITNIFANHSDGTMYNDMSADPTGNNHTKLNLRSVAGASVFYLTLQYTKLS